MHDNATTPAAGDEPLDDVEAERIVLGWREWVQLPDLGVDWCKAKVDTGARTSALHAADLELFERDGHPWARFVAHPWQESDDDPVEVETPVVEQRDVRSSSGHAQERPVIRTSVVIGEAAHDVELTLTRRDDMGFRMLLGRTALEDRFVVDPAASYLAGQPARLIRRRNRAVSTEDS